MATIKTQNNYSWLLSEDVDLKDFLASKMRFRAKGAYFNAAYTNKRWDGYTKFFDKNSGQFLTGLLPEVKLALKHLKVDYQIQDDRDKFSFATETVDDNWLNCGTSPIVLRDYQVDYINQAIRVQRGVIPSPTGSGKSAAMAGIIKAIPPKTPTLVLVNTQDLVEQNYEEICRFGIQNVGRYYGRRKEPNYITCCTVQSVKGLKSVLGRIKVLIVDEVHKMMSKQSKNAYRMLTGAEVRIGMSATAFKFGGTDKIHKYDVKGWIGPEFYSVHTETGKITAKELQERDVLSDATCRFYTVTEPQLPYDIYLDAVTRGIAENDHFHQMVKALVSTLKGRTLIIVERIEHGDRLHDLIPGAVWVRGKDTAETRKEIIGRLKTEQGDLVGIATSGIFDVGINCRLHNLVNCASGQAEHVVIQRFGRGLRTADDKSQLNYYDFIFDINPYLYKHSMKRIRILEKEGHKVEII